MSLMPISAPKVAQIAGILIDQGRIDAARTVAVFGRRRLGKPRHRVVLGFRGLDVCAPKSHRPGKYQRRPQRSGTDHRTPPTKARHYNTCAGPLHSGYEGAAAGVGAAFFRRITPLAGSQGLNRHVQG